MKNSQKLLRKAEAELALRHDLLHVDVPGQPGVEPVRPGHRVREDQVEALVLGQPRGLPGVGRERLRPAVTFGRGSGS